MRFSRTMTALAVSSALVASSGCTTNPETGNRVISKTAIGGLGGLVAGYLAGDVLGGRNDRTAKILGAGIGAIGGAAVGNYMDRQEAALRRDTAGTGVDVIRQGDDIVLRMPSGITFDINRYDVKPQFQSTLNEVASTLGTYQQTYIDVLGHTDSTGSDAINQPLSERRALAVADYLSSRGVNKARIGTRGFGATQPISDNGSEYGRAQNRRVEIKVVPFQGQ